jgi:hypothetical protein
MGTKQNKKSITLPALLILVLLLTGCVSGRTISDSYSQSDGMLSGDTSKEIPPVKNIVIWPLENTDVDAESKFIRDRITKLFAYKFYMIGEFAAVVTVSDKRSRDLLTRAGEELGLKRKPRGLHSGMVVAKVGQLTGGDAFFAGVANIYEEDSGDKTFTTMAEGLFTLIDARANAYDDIDSCTPRKLLWQANIKQIYPGTRVSDRRELDNIVEKMVDKVVETFIFDLTTAQINIGYSG